MFNRRFPGMGQGMPPPAMGQMPMRGGGGPDTSQSISVSPGMGVQGPMPSPKGLQGQGGFQGFDDPQPSAYKRGGKVKKPKGVGKATKGYGKGKMR